MQDPECEDTGLKVSDARCRIQDYRYQMQVRDTGLQVPDASAGYRRSCILYLASLLSWSANEEGESLRG
jgi:hypothetical protein